MLEVQSTRAFFGHILQGQPGSDLCHGLPAGECVYTWSTWHAWNVKFPVPWEIIGMGSYLTVVHAFLAIYIIRLVKV